MIKVSFCEDIWESVDDGRAWGAHVQSAQALFQLVSS